MEYVGRELEPAQPAKAAPGHFSSNEAAPRGRLILLLVDRGNIGQGGGREVISAADRFLANLAPADRVGLAFIPGPGMSMQFSPDHDAVRRGLRSFVGTASRGGYQVPLSEALALIERHDELRWQQYVQLNCLNYKIAEQIESCRRQLEVEREPGLRQLPRALARHAARTRRHASRHSRASRARRRWCWSRRASARESQGEMRELATAASEAQVTLYVVLLNTANCADASFAGLAPRWRAPRTGSRKRAASTRSPRTSRGLVLNAVNKGDAAFQRIGRELMGYYLLGFEPEPGDRDGKSHSVKVTVSRPDAGVRARSLLSIPAAPPSQQAMLVGALRSPLVDRGLPMQATAYALRDASAGKVRLLITARVGRASRPLSVGFSVSDAAGKVVASRAYEGIAGGAGEWVDFTGEAVVDARAYTLRVAAVDAAGRRGSVEHAVKAAPVSAGGLEISDLVLAASSTGGAVRPAVDLELAGGGLTALLELGGRDAARVERATVALELADTVDGPALLRVPVPVGAPRKDGVREASVAIAAGLLPPGTYAARAEVSLDGKPVGVVTRPFRIAPAHDGAGANSPLASLLADPRPFDKAELLAPEPLRHFAERVFTALAGPVSPGLAAALEEARGGRPATIARQARGGRPGGRARGVPARRIALRPRPDWGRRSRSCNRRCARAPTCSPRRCTPGACYASIGKDLEAIGAWQTALVGETGGSPVLYALLADALTRVKEPQEAIDILVEGLGAFPEDAGLRRRLASPTPRRATATRRCRCSPRGSTRTPTTTTRCSRRSPCCSTASRARRPARAPASRAAARARSAPSSCASPAPTSRATARTAR